VATGSQDPVAVARAARASAARASAALASAALVAVAAVMSVWLGPGAPIARAHPAEFGSIHVRALGRGRHAVRFEYSGNETAPRGAEIAWPEGCELEGSIARTERPYGEAQRMIVVCDERGLLREAEVTSLPMDVEVAVHVEAGGGSLRDRRRHLLLDASTPRFSLSLPNDDTGTLAARFVELGLLHIATGPDHLAFVALLVLVLRARRARHARGEADGARSMRRLLESTALTLTAFTLGHAVTLALSVLGVLMLAAPPVEVCIALSVLLLSAEVARVERGRAPDTLIFLRPALVASSFGLVHGLGFAGALREAGLEEGALAVPLISFHVGVELGQLAFVALVLATLCALEGRAWSGRARLAITYVTGAAAAAWTLARLGAIGA
jgi:hypothetical protein